MSCLKILTESHIIFSGSSAQYQNNVSPDRDRPYSQKKSQALKKTVTFHSDENNNDNNVTGSLPQEEGFVSPQVENVNQSPDGNYGIQGLVQKFSQEKKTSRQVLFYCNPRFLLENDKNKAFHYQ